MSRDERGRALAALEGLRYAEQDARLRAVHRSEEYVRRGVLTASEAAAGLGVSRATWFRLRAWASSLSL